MRYTVTANGCSNSAVATVTVSQVPAIFGLASTDGTQSGGLKLTGSEKGVRYQLFRNGTAVGSPVLGTGSALQFNASGSGDYSVTASTESGCTTSTGRTAFDGSALSGGLNAGNLSVNAYPNPYTDRVRFVIESDFSGNAVLDIYNTTGVRLQTVYKGFSRSHLSQSVDFFVPALISSNLVYVVTVDGHRATGKLINIR